MAEQQIANLATRAAPLTRVTKDSEEFELLAVNANFDGSGAASAFLPCVEVVSDAGIVVARSVATDTVAAGGSAEVTFAPFLGRSASGGGIDFDKLNVGGWLSVETTSTGAPFGGAVEFNVGTGNFNVFALAGQIYMDGDAVSIFSESFDMVLDSQQEITIHSRGAGVNQWTLDGTLSLLVAGNAAIQSDTYNLDTNGKATLTIGGNLEENVAGNFTNITDGAWSLNAANVGIHAATGNIALGLEVGGAVTVLNHLGAVILRVTEDGTYHIKSGAAWVADL